jgi:hypothetical protein
VVEIVAPAALPMVMRDKGGVRSGSSRLRKLREAGAQAAGKHRHTRGRRTGCRRLSRRQRSHAEMSVQVHVPSTQRLRHNVRRRQRLTDVKAWERAATAAGTWAGDATAATAWRCRRRCHTGC